MHVVGLEADVHDPEVRTDERGLHRLANCVVGVADAQVADRVDDAQRDVERRHALEPRTQGVALARSPGLLRGASRATALPAPFRELHLELRVPFSRPDHTRNVDLLTRAVNL